jgi:HEXXH motif-containing protein
MMLTRHRLPSAQFEALAAGAGGAAGELRSGQLSKRVLQIVTLLGEISARCPDTFAAGGFQDSYATLAAARRRSQPATDAVLLHPQVGAWAAHALRRLVSTAAGDRSLDDDLGHFGAVAVAAALAAREGFDLTLRVRSDGTLMVPTFGLARLGLGPAWCRARAGPGADGVDLDVGGGSVVSVPVRSPVSSSRWWPLRRLRSTVDGCRIDVVLDDIDPYRDCHRIGAADRLPAAEITRWQALLDEAWTLLVRRQGRRAASLSAGVQTLVPLQPSERAAELSASSRDACGAIALTPSPDGPALAVALVHEFQHSKLSALLDLVPLHDAGPDATFYAPWRSDPRPLAGLLQGSYAHLGLVDYWHVQRLVEAGARRRVAHFEFARWTPAVRRTLHTLSASGRLTDVGRRFVAGMRRRLVELRASPVPPEPRTLARDAAVDHWVTWRLRNLRPDPGQIDGWVEAWLDAAPCAPMARLASAMVVAGDPGWAGSGARLELAYLRLRDPGRLSALSADPSRLAAEIPGAVTADCRYVRADHSTAARLYRDELAASPARVDLWAGLVLAHRRLRTPAFRFLVSYPECVLAAHERIRAATGATPDAAELAAWLDRAHRAAYRRRVESV